MSLRLNNGVTHQMGRDWFPPGNYQNQAMTIAVHATIATTPATFDYFVHMSLLTSGLPALGFWWGISNAAQMCAGTGTVKLMSNPGWAAFTSGAHKYVWTYDGTSATPTINAYLDNVVRGSSATAPTRAGIGPPMAPSTSLRSGTRCCRPRTLPTIRAGSMRGSSSRRISCGFTAW